MSAIASTELVRQKNSLSVMAALRLHGSLSHTDMSTFTGLASATVSAITTELERAGLILRKEQLATAGRGRPRILFGPRGAFCHVAIVIISSDSVQYSLVDYAGKLVDRFTEQRIAAEKGTFVGAILGGLARLADRSRIDSHDILQVSISSKGLVDAGAATLLWSPVLGDEKIDFRQLVSQDGRTRVTLNNETLLAAKAIWMGEHAKGNPAPDALVTLSLGHSIGLGVARATGGMIEVSAPNFGHMLHLADGALCRCGTKGCIEAYSGFYAILRSAFEAPPQAEPAKFVPIAEVDKIAASARAGTHGAVCVPHRWAGARQRPFTPLQPAWSYAGFHHRPRHALFRPPGKRPARRAGAIASSAFRRHAGNCNSTERTGTGVRRAYGTRSFRRR